MLVYKMINIFFIPLNFIQRSKSNVFNVEKKAEKDVQNIFSNQFLTTESSIKSFASNDIKK